MTTDEPTSRSQVRRLAIQKAAGDTIEGLRQELANLRAVDRGIQSLRDQIASLTVENERLAAMVISRTTFSDILEAVEAERDRWQSDYGTMALNFESTEVERDEALQARDQSQDLFVAASTERDRLRAAAEDCLRLASPGMSSPPHIRLDAVAVRLRAALAPNPGEG